jgi:hypothetical protein
MYLKGRVRKAIDPKWFQPPKMSVWPRIIPHFKVIAVRNNHNYSTQHCSPTPTNNQPHISAPPLSPHAPLYSHKACIFSVKENSVMCVPENPPKFLEIRNTYKRKYQALDCRSALVSKHCVLLLQSHYGINSDGAHSPALLTPTRLKP